MKRHGLVLVLVCAVVLAGCGGTDRQPQVEVAPPLSGTFNDTDVMYLQMMLAHYRPGAEMIAVAKTHPLRSEVSMLASAIEVTEADESKLMQAWLRGWDQPATPATDPILHADHGGLPGDGETELETLSKASDTQFETTFLNLLIGYQHRAVELAQMQLGGGINPEVKQLALRIADSRRAQVSHMLRLLGSAGT